MPDLVTSITPGPTAVFARLHAGDGVIVDTETAFYYGLNRTAAFLWQLLQDQPLSAAQMVETLCKEFDVTPEAAQKDVERFVVQLERYGLVARSAK